MTDRDAGAPAAATIPAALLEAARRFGDRPALVRHRTGPSRPQHPGDGAGTTSWDAVLDTARRGAGVLAGLGVSPGERVALWGANSPEWVTAELAALCAGAVVVPVNARYRLEETADIVTRARCSLVLADGETPGSPGAPGTPSLAEQVATVTGARVLSLAGEAPRVGASWPELLAGAGPPSAATDRRMARLTPTDVSHVQFTSGTTGRPKGALLAHGAMVATTCSWSAIVGLGPDDRYPVVAPFSHVAGHKSGILACVVTGAALRPLPAFDAEGLAELLADGGATVLQGAPSMFRALLGAVERRGLTPRGVNVAVAGAAAVPPDLVHRLRGELGARAVLNGYGLSEATGVCTITRRHDPEEVLVSTCGRPVPGVEIRVVGGDGAALGPDEPGEVQVRGVNVMQGYLDEPEATAAALVHGWLRTGDVGVVDRAGNLRIVDRLKDLVVVGGFNVSPAEVERVLAEDPEVADVAVVGAPDDQMGEVPVAFVVPAGPALDPDGVEARARERLAGFKVPRRYVAVPSMPVTAAGKVDKRALRDRLADPAP